MKRSKSTDSQIHSIDLLPENGSTLNWRNLAKYQQAKKGISHHEEKQIYRRTNSVWVEAGGTGNECFRGMPKAGNKRGDILHMEEKIWWAWCIGTQETSSAGR